MIEKSNLKMILDKLNIIKTNKKLSTEEESLMNKHIKVINEIISKNLKYDKKIIPLYNQIIEVYNGE